MFRSALICLAVLLSSPLRAAPGAYDLEVAARKDRFEREVARPRSPAAIVPLLGLVELWDLVEDRDALYRLVETAATTPADLSPDVRAHAQLLLRELAWHRGDEALAARLGAELGIVRRCRIIGPFDNDGRKGHSTVYPPEVAEGRLSADMSYEGKIRALPPRWRAAPALALGRDGRFVLDGVLGEGSWVTAYAACDLHSAAKEPLPVALRVGTSGALKLWLNRGPPIIDHEVYRPLRYDQDAVAATLSPGWNRVLLKVSSADGPLAFVLRLTAPDGRPLRQPMDLGDGPPPSFVPPRGLAPRAGASLLRKGLQAALRAAPVSAKAQALRDLGAYLYYVAPGDPELREAETAFREAQRLQPTAAGARLLAMSASDDNDRRRALLAGLARAPADDPGRGRLLLDLAKIDEEGRRDEIAEAGYRAAQSRDPSLYTAVVHLSQLQANRGLLAEAERLLASLPGRSLRLLRTRLGLAARRGRIGEVDKAYTRLLFLEKDDLESLRHGLDRCRARGDVDGALRYIGRIRRDRPELSWPYQEEIEVLEGAGRNKEALFALDALLLAEPGESTLQELRGRLLLRLGRVDEARGALRRSLELRPQNPELRSYLAHLSPASRSGDDLVQAYRVEMKDLRRSGAKKGADPAQVLLDQTVTRVHANGLSEVFTQRVVEVLDDQGAREYADFDIRYTPDTQSVQVKAARIHKKDGTVQEIAQQGEQDVSEPWYGLYYDVRAATLRFDGLSPGDVIDVQYVVADVGRRNLLSDYFGDLHFLQEEIPRRDSRYVLVVSEPGGKRRPLYFNAPQEGPGWHVERSERLLGGGKEREYAFRAVDVPRIETEAGMPGLTEVTSFLHVSTYRSWEDVASWYKGLIREQLQSSPEIGAAARAAVAGLRDERARISAIYQLVVKKTRYVGLEFGIHGYKPYKVAQVFARKFGDCKDKAALLHVMLKEVGIESSMVLARTRRSGDLPAEPASLSAFDHAIVYVPRFDLYLDGTAEFSGAGELPAEDQDIPVLIIDDSRPPYLGRGHLARTPVLPSSHNAVSRQLDVSLREDGGTVVEESMRVAGQAAQKFREHYQSTGAQKERYETAWNEHHPGVKVLRVALPAIDRLDQPVTLRGAVDVPAWARVAGRELVLRSLGRDPELLRTYARLSQRRHDLILSFPWRSAESVTLHLPRGFVARRLPSPGRLEAPFGRFVFSLAEGPGKITISADLVIEKHRITSADYAAFRRFCAAVDSLVAQDLVVARE